MGQLNVTGHLLTATMGGTDSLWDLLQEVCEIANQDGPTVHSMNRDTGEPRYCLHPTSCEDVQLRDDCLDVLLGAGIMYVAREHFGEEYMWPR